MAAVPVILELPARTDPQQGQPVQITVTDRGAYPKDVHKIDL